MVIDWEHRIKTPSTLKGHRERSLSELSVGTRGSIRMDVSVGNSIKDVAKFWNVNISAVKACLKKDY
jgi:hypothetical protein